MASMNPESYAETCGPARPFITAAAGCKLWRRARSGQRPACPRGLSRHCDLRGTVCSRSNRSAAPPATRGTRAVSSASDPAGSKREGARIFARPRCVGGQQTHPFGGCALPADGRPIQTGVKRNGKHLTAWNSAGRLPDATAELCRRGVTDLVSFTSYYRHRRRRDRLPLIRAQEMARYVADGVRDAG